MAGSKENHQALEDARLDENPLSEADLRFLIRLIQRFRPKKMMQAGAALSGIAELLSRQVRALGDGGEVYAASERGLPACLEEVGPGIDFLVLDARDRTPGELLDFLAAFPYLRPDAVVAVYGPASRKSGADSMLMRSVTGERFPDHTDAGKDLKDYIRSQAEEAPAAERMAEACALTAVRLNQDTARYLGDLFAVLWAPWPFLPDVGDLRAYGAWFERHYGREYVHIYRKAAIEAVAAHHPEKYLARYRDAALAIEQYEEFLSSMAQSLLGRFHKILLYGNGERGTYMLSLSKWLGMDVSGFVVSDGRRSAGKIMDVPVYEFSKIPFAPEEVVVIQTANSAEVEGRLKAGKYAWLKVPDAFWYDSTVLDIMRGR